MSAPLRIVMFSTLPGALDVRAQRAGRVLQSLGHEVIFVSGSRGPNGSVDLESNYGGAVVGTPMWCDGFRTFIPRLTANHIASIDREIAPDVVWTHGLAAAWRYCASATVTPEVEDGILEDRFLSEIPWEASKSKKAKLVVDVHEYEPDRPHAYPRKKNRADWIERERRVLPLADAVVTVGREIAHLTDARRLSSTDAHVVTNAPPWLGRPLRTEEARAELVARGLKGPIIVFAGNPTPDRDLVLLETALEHLPREVYFLMLTTFVAKWPSAHAVTNAPYPWPENAHRLTLLDYLSACDAAWNGAWCDFENWRSGAPNKLYEYASAGVAQVFPREMIEASRLAHVESGFGLGFDRGARGAAEAFERILEHQIRVSPEFYETHHFEAANRTALEKVIESIR